MSQQARKVRARRSGDGAQGEPELLDRPLLPQPECERALRDLGRSNRLLLGMRPVQRTLLPRLEGGPARQRLLDVGTGGGEVPAGLAQEAKARGISLGVVGLDRRLGHLLVGHRVGGAQRGVVADALALPFRSGSFDFSLCTLLFHHFDRVEKRRLVAEMRRVATQAAVVIDLRRSPWTRWAIRLLLPLIGVGKTARHDGRVSAERSSKIEEVAAILGGEPIAELRRRFPCRYSVVLPGGDGSGGRGEDPNLRHLAPVWSPDTP